MLDIELHKSLVRKLIVHMKIRFGLDFLRAQGTFNGFGGTIVLDLFAAHEHRYVIGDGDTGGDREGGVRDAADKIKGGG